MRTSQIAAYKARALRIETSDAAYPHIVGFDSTPEPRPEMVCFRGQTLALVRHFFEISSQVGRVSSLLGREFFRSRVSHHSIPSFEEQAVFVRDIELCLAKLRDEPAEVLTLHGLYDYSIEEVSQRLQCSRSLVRHHFYEALDTLSEIFLSVGLLRENRPDRQQRQMRYNGLAPEIVAPPRKPPASVRQVPTAATSRAGADAGKRGPRSA